MASRVLLVMPPERRERLLRVLSDGGLEIATAENITEAQMRMSASGKFDLAFVDSDLPDGSWRDMLQLIVASGAGCEMVVCARCGDERLWAEVIQCGAFDLVPEPFERQEVLRIVNSALDSRYLQRFGRSESVSVG
ncbi:MAG TPA: response regulator [Terriglobia bacterium]|nr:response regulator [Terriglobia bacterium]